MIAPLPKLGADWRAYFSGDEGFEFIFAGEDAPTYLTRQQPELTDETEAHTKGEDPPICVAGAKTERPCQQEATSRVGKALLCEAHARVPGISPEVERAEVAVWYLRSFESQAHGTRNPLLVRLIEEAMEEADDVRLDAYEHLDVQPPVRLIR